MLPEQQLIAGCGIHPLHEHLLFRLPLAAVSQAQGQVAL